MSADPTPRLPHELGDQPRVDDALTALIQAAAHFAFLASAEYRRGQPAEWAKLLEAFNAGAEVETRVRVAPTPGVRLFLTLPGGGEQVFFEMAVRERGKPRLLN